jgi:hypothetical protein
MSNLYHKIAVASICTALCTASSFILGANQEVKAATFTLTAKGFSIAGSSRVGGLWLLNTDGSGPFDASSPFIYKGYYDPEDQAGTRAFYEFNIGNLSLAPNTVIKNAFFNVYVRNINVGLKYFFTDFVGYAGNGIPDLSDYQVGESLSSLDLSDIKRIYNPYWDYPLKMNVTPFVNQLVKNGDAFAGFGFQPSDYTFYSTGSANFSKWAELNIETEPVPEPTTIFGSALALSIGGWLKRKKSSQQNKTTSQH